MDIESETIFVKLIKTNLKKSDGFSDIMASKILLENLHFNPVNGKPNALTIRNQ
jgi:hypothetical protein